MILEVMFTLLVGTLAFIAICLMFEFMEFTILLAIIMIFGVLFRGLFGF